MLAFAISLPVPSDRHYPIEALARLFWRTFEAFCGAAGNSLAAARSVLVVVPANSARGSVFERHFAGRITDKSVASINESFMGNNGALGDLAGDLILLTFLL